MITRINLFVQLIMECNGRRMFSSFFIFIIGIILITRWPEVFVAMFFVGQFFIQGMLGGNVSRSTFGYVNIAIFAIFVVYGIMMIQNRPRLIASLYDEDIDLPVKSNQANYLMTFLFFVGYASVYYLASRLNRFALIQLLTLFYMLPIIFVLSLVKPTFSINRFAFWITIFVLIRIFVLMTFEATNGSVDLQIGFRNVSAQLLGMNFDGGIWFGRFVGLMLISLLYFVDRNKLPHFIILPFVIVLLAAGSRGPLVAFLFAYLFWNYTRKKFETVLVLIPILVGAVIFLIYQGNEIAIFYRYSVESIVDEEGSVNIRLQLLAESYRILQDEFLFGIGPFNFGPMTNSWGGDYPHNIFIEFFLWYGIPGLIMAYFLIIKPFVSIPVKENLLPEQRFIICLAIFSLCAAQFSGHIGTNDTAFYSCALLSSMDFSRCDDESIDDGIRESYSPI